MNYHVGLRFEDGRMQFIGCRPGERLADAAIRQGVRIPVDCREGACGTCRCQVETGQYDLGDCVEDALSPSDAAQGHALACQLRLQSDAVVHIPVSAASCQAQTEAWSVSLQTLERVGDRMMRLRVQSDALKSLQFLPGQYGKLGAPGLGHTRAYSFSSLVSREGEVEFLVRLVPDGLMSQWLSQHAAVGAELTLTAPFGGFYLRPVVRPVVMLAGGTGLAPMLSMLEHMDTHGLRDQPCLLMLGVNDDGDAAVAAELPTWQMRLPQLQWQVCVADAASALPHKGYVTDHLTAELLHHGEADLYVCGPPAMVSGVQGWLDTQGLKPAGFYHERFNPSA